MKKTILIAMIVLLVPFAMALDIDIEQPTGEYDTSTVDFEGSTDNVSDSISYMLDDQELVLVCYNCSEFSGSLENVTEGNHTFTVFATIDNETVNETSDFSVSIPEPLEITIISPEEDEYDEQDIDLDVETNTPADLHYELDNESAVLACENCTGFETELENLSEANHTIRVFSGNTSETVEFSIELPDEELVITIISPGEDTYDNDEVELEVETNLPSDLYYELDNQSAVLACENCTGFETELENLSEANHTIRVFSGNTSETVEFTIDFKDEPEDLVIDIESPEDKTYDTRDIDLEVDTNIATDLYYELDNDSAILACTECTGFETELEDLVEGQHTIRVFSGNVSESVSFQIELDNETDEDNESDEPRFDIGFNKLPQALESGQIDNEDLRDILEDNKLNPGTLNRLAKTGLLEEETIDLIIETQFTPKGILQKLLGWLITDNDDVAESLFQEYDLTEEQQAELLSNKEGIGEGLVKKIAKQNRIKEQAINRIVDTWDEDVTETIIETQTLGKSNVDKIISKGLAKKEARKLVENQVLDEEQIEDVSKAWGKEKDISKALEEVSNGKSGKGKSSAPGQNKVTGKSAKENPGKGRS